jgi:octopine/nopaline transport system substrate-binding protein
MSKKLLVAALAGLLAMGAAAPADAQQKRVRIGTEGAYAPWNATDTAGKLVGFEIDLGNEICKRQNLQCEWVAQAFDGIIPALQAGRFDAIMAGMSITERRLETIDFTQPYAGTPSIFAVLKGSPMAGAIGPAGDRVPMGEDTPARKAALDKLSAALKGKTVGVQRATIQEAFLNDFMKGVVTVRLYDTNENLLLDINAGRVDAGFASYSYWLPATEKEAGKNLAIVGNGFSGGGFGRGVGVGVRKGDAETKKLFDDGLAALKKDGTIKELAMKWFKFDATVD